MIFFQLIGLSLATVFILWIAALGLFCGLFGGMGGNQSRGELIFCAAAFIGGLSGVYWLWSNNSPLTLVVSP